ncbi:hypothetical protein I4U23_011806 [Adineta vaga]|nr:hypothetical protein I4U23_011806 [Adineta vaga]
MNKDMSREIDMSSSTFRPPVVRTMSMPNTSTSPLAHNPWYRQKFEFYRDVIEEKVRDEYPDVPTTYKLEPNNIEQSTTKGYDLDFPIDLHDGRSTIVSVAYSSGGRPPYSKEERSKLVTIRQYTTEN